MNHDLFVFLGTAGLISIILVVLIWQLAVTWRAKAALVREGEYRKLGERAIASQEDTRRQLEQMGAQLTETQNRLAAIERVLTVVD